MAAKLKIHSRRLASRPVSPKKACRGWRSPLGEAEESRVGEDFFAPGLG